MRASALQIFLLQVSVDTVFERAQHNTLLTTVYQMNIYSG